MSQYTNALEAIAEPWCRENYNRDNHIDLHSRAYRNWFRGGRTWATTKLRGTQQLRIIIWYQNRIPNKPNHEWRPSIILAALLKAHGDSP